MTQRTSDASRPFETGGTGPEPRDESNRNERGDLGNSARGRDGSGGDGGNSARSRDGSGGDGSNGDGGGGDGGNGDGGNGAGGGGDGGGGAAGGGNIRTDPVMKGQPRNIPKTAEQIKKEIEKKNAEIEKWERSLGVKLKR